MPKIWTDISLVPDAKSLLTREAELFGPGISPGGADPLQGIEQAAAAMTGARVRWDATLLQRAKSLQIVARSGIGYDNIDVDAATACGVCVTNTPDSPTESTAEFTIALMLSAARKLSLADRRFKAEGWIAPHQFAGIELAGKTLGLVGLGRVGSRVAEIALALRMRIVACDPFVKAETVRARGIELKADLKAVLAEADIVSLHVPLTAQNRGLMGANEFKAMKRGALLINAARGPIVVESALLEALKSGHLAGAGLDVWDPEPPAAGNPLILLDNVVAAPHIAGATAEAYQRGHLGAAECVLMTLRGELPKTLVNPEVWARRRPAS
jgi:D-3-phosphoglycerate dehydrogenase